MKRKLCQLCNRRLPDSHKHAVWCRVCYALHTILTPCARCEGEIHVPDDGYGHHITTLT